MEQFTTPNGFIILGEDIDGILANAFEGQANYWITKINPSHYPKGAEFGSDVLSRGATIDIYPSDDDEIVTDASEFYTLTLEGFLKGIDLFLKWANERGWTYLDSEDLATDADADYIIQFSLFGQLVYG